MHTHTAEVSTNLPVYPTATKDLPEGEFVWIEEVARHINCFPANKRERRKRAMVTIRPTVLAIVHNRCTHEVLLVQTNGAATNQFCPPQGEIEPSETVVAATKRVVKAEANIQVAENDARYLGSMLLPVPPGSEKEEANLSHQLFHVTFVTTNVSDARAGTNVRCALFAHFNSLPELMHATASPQKQGLLAAVFAEVHEQQLLPRDPLATEVV